VKERFFRALCHAGHFLKARPGRATTPRTLAHLHGA
jgi:hypothetical protein